MRRGSCATSSWIDRIRLSWSPGSVENAFTLGGLASGNDADDVSGFALAVANKQQSGPRAHAQQQEPLFTCRVVVVEKLHGKFIVEDRLGFLKGHTVLLEVCRGFGRIVD